MVIFIEVEQEETFYIHHLDGGLVSALETLKARIMPNPYRFLLSD